MPVLSWALLRTLPEPVVPVVSEEAVAPEEAVIDGERFVGDRPRARVRKEL